jgi:hypothetical protein
MTETLVKHSARQDSLYNVYFDSVYIPTTVSEVLEFEATPITLAGSERASATEEVGSSRTDEVYTLIIDNLKEVGAVMKIVMAMPHEELLRIWTIVSEEDKEVMEEVFQRERAIINALSGFEVGLDFYVATEDMLDAFIDDETLVIYTRPSQGRQL